MKKTIATGLLILTGYSALLAWASGTAGGSTSVPFSAYDFSLTPTGVLATLEFETQSDRLYSILRSPDLASNAWDTIAADLPGTGSSLVYHDLTALTEPARFYKASFATAPPQNLIQNDGFEEPALADGGTDISTSGDWVQGGNNQSIQKAGYAAETGSQGVWLKAWNSNLDRYFYQDVDGTAGVEYTLDAGFKFETNFESNGGTLEMAMIWLNSGGSEISRLTLDVNANLNAAEGWKHLSLAGTAPAGTAAVRAWFRWTTDSNIENSSSTSAFVDNVSLLAGPLGTSVEAVDWGSLGSASRVAAAQYAGHYAVAAGDIEITAIDESVVDTIAAAEMDALLAGAGINGITFTASGRQLFISANGTGSDSVLAYNAGTGALRNFVTGLSLASGTEKLGIAHFKGELFVGTASGEIRRYDARLDDAAGSYNGSISFSGGDTGQPVRGIAVDIQDEMLYVASPNTLYRLNPVTSSLSPIASLAGIEGISFGRTYGSNGQGGLILLQDAGAERTLLLVSTAALQAGGSVSPSPYFSTGSGIPDIAATACGRLLAAGGTACMLSDVNDSRMGFMEWVADEFDQNIRFAKTLCWQDGGLTGMVQNTVVKNGNNRGSVASPDAAYWVVCQLIMSDEVNGDPEARGLVREIVKRYAALDVNSDGQWYHWYDSITGDRTWGDVEPDGKTSIFSTMKACHMAIRAMTYYPNDTEIVNAANTLLGRLRNQRDYIREFGTQKSPADDLGPVPDSIQKGIFSPYIETHLFSELMAATEPMCENAYLDYWRYRDTHTYNYTLPDEPIVRNNAAGFWRMYDQATIRHCRESTEWTQEFRNFYALFAGWTDDHAPEHLTAFSAGQVPDTSKPDPSTTYAYSADKYTYHPGTVNSFGTVIGFGLHGDTVPVVGAYFAYRDGRRQLMEGSATITDPNLLTRISYDYPTWILNNLSPTDHQYAGYALGELLSPGSVNRAIALHTYLEPQWSVQTNGDYRIEFSRVVPRRIYATTDGINWDYLGFRYSPYTVPAAYGYTNFIVAGAEGEQLVPAAETALEQDYDVAADFDGTIYIVRGVTDSPTAQVRAQWFNGGSFISGQTGPPDGLNAVKPAGAAILRIALVEGAVPVAAGQLSVELDGALETFSNAGFETGNFSGWTSAQQSGMSRANVADSRLEGSRACRFTASVGAANGNYAQVFHEYDISGDPTNTHYVVEFDTLTENLQGSSVRARVQIYNGASSQIRAEYFDTFGQADTRTVLSAGFRKRDTDHVTVRVILRLQRDNAAAVTAEERVLVDNLRLLKMQP
jgi:hypothetical protein